MISPPRALAVIALLSLAAMACGPKAVRHRLPRYYTAEQFMSTLKVWGSSFSTDERHLLVTSNATGTFNAYAYPVAGGAPEPLTESTTSNVRSICYFPSDDRVLLTADVNGNERFHLFVRLLDGRILDITPDADARAEFLHWRADQKGFYYTSNRRDGRAEDVYLFDIGSMTSRLVWMNNQAMEVMRVSHDDRRVLLLRSNTAEDADAFIADLTAGGSVKPLLVNEKAEVNYTPLHFSRDDRFIFLLTNEGSEFMRFEQLELASGQRTVLHRDDWDVLYGFHSHNERYRVVLVNRDARIDVQITDLRSGRRIELPRLPEGDITKVDISPSERYMSFYVNSSTSPNNLFVYDFEQQTYRQLTRTLSPDIRPEDMVSGRTVRYSSFDGMSIPAILYEPHIRPAEGLPPAVIYLHGGPGGQSRLIYSPILQFLVNHGYVVLDINYRGSLGYGKAFYAADNRRHGDGDLKDVLWAKRFLGEQGLADTSRVGLFGGSYGGFLVLSALAKHPDAFAAGVDMFGIADLVSTLKNMPPWWEHVRKAYYVELGDPYTEEAFLRAKSPYYFAEQIRRPLLVLQGQNDPRVSKAQVDSMVERVRAVGTEVEYTVFADEGHGFYKRANEIQAYGSILRFLDRHLQPQRLPARMPLALDSLPLTQPLTLQQP